MDRKCWQFTSWDNLNLKCNINYQTKPRENEIKERIKNNAKSICGLAKEEGVKGKVSVKMHKGVNFSSYFFFDKICCFSPYLHRSSRGDQPPTFIMKDNGAEGSFYDFCRKDMEKIIKEAKDYKPED